MIFADEDADFAALCLHHAKELYDFADEYQGVYTDAIPARDFYNSWSGYKVNPSGEKIIYSFESKRFYNFQIFAKNAKFQNNRSG